MDKETREAIEKLTNTMERGFGFLSENMTDLRHTMEKGFTSVTEDLNHRLDNKVTAPHDQEERENTVTIGQLIDVVQHRTETQKSP